MPYRCHSPVFVFRITFITLPVRWTRAIAYHSVVPELPGRENTRNGTLVCPFKILFIGLVYILLILNTAFGP